MFVPYAVLIGPHWAGTLSGGALLGAMHVLTLPAMAIAMLRWRDEYAQNHQRHVRTHVAAGCEMETLRVMPISFARR